MINKILKIEHEEDTKISENSVKPVTEEIDLNQSITNSQPPESQINKPTQPPTNVSQLSPIGPIKFDSDGYEWFHRQI